MAFKKSQTGSPAYDTPYDLFKTLSGRQFPDLMTHQIKILESYQKDGLDKKDVALQLPTGSGKTLVGLLIGEWRRRKFNERVLIVCPTKQLVNQTNNQAVESHKIRTIPFTGSKREYNPNEFSEYQLAKKVGITNYSSLFNTKPAFEKPDVVIIDDAHAAENYIANMWSVSINPLNSYHKALFDHIAICLKSKIKNLDYVRLSGKGNSQSGIGVIEKLPTPALHEISDELTHVISQYIEDTDQKYAWSLLRGKLLSCHLYYSASGILIRPIIPPTWSLNSFTRAKQRIYMSATLGNGGDLERLTGRKKIHRIATPKNFQSQGVGRRFFIFPELQCGPEEADKQRLTFIKRAGRSVVITPDKISRDRIATAIENELNFKTFSARDIEESKSNFLATSNASAVMANRYDGVDFPNDESRLLCVDSLPRAANLQEMFLMTRLSAQVLFNERVQTRVIQAIGRCTRALQDYSAIFVTGRELQNTLTEPSNQKYLSPELQAEIKFGINQSIDIPPAEMFENFEIFLEHGEEWETANEQIVRDTKDLKQESFPALASLASSVASEVNYMERIWAEDYLGALESAKEVLSKITNGSELRGFRGLWNYLAGSAAYLESQSSESTYISVARDHYKAAMAASSGLSWLAKLSRLHGIRDIVVDNKDNDLDRQIEALGKTIVSLGNLHDKNFAEKEADILTGLNDPKTFEKAHRDLGLFLGFDAGKVETSGSPDPWWLSDSKCFVFEDHAGAKEKSVLDVKKCRQVSSHPQWIEENLREIDNQEIISILISPVSKVDRGGAPHLKTVSYWNLEDFRNWVKNSFSVIRALRTELKAEPDLVWITKAKELMEDNLMTANSLSKFFEENIAYNKLEHVFMKPK